MVVLLYSPLKAALLYRCLSFRVGGLAVLPDPLFLFLDFPSPLLKTLKGQA